VRVVKLLLKRGANVHARFGEAATPLAEAAESKRFGEADEIAAILLGRHVPGVRGQQSGRPYVREGI